MVTLSLFPGFRSVRIDVGAGVDIHALVGGSGPPLLLLHGHPQTLAIWHRVAPRLAERFTVVACDLRGYGDSSKPAGDADHANYSKRTMAADVLAVMHSLGFQTFRVLAHDRGARVAHRLALDHPQAVERLALLDIAPTLAMYEQTSDAFARAYWHWFFLIQPEPVPERIVLRPRSVNEKPFTVRAEGGEEHRFYRVRGAKPERWVQQTDFTNEEAIGYLADRLAKLGVEDGLFKAGAVAGSTVVIGGDGGMVFDWEPTLTSTAELITSARGTDARIGATSRPTRNERREEYFERMDAKAAARAELEQERVSGLWVDDDVVTSDQLGTGDQFDGDQVETSDQKD